MPMKKTEKLTCKNRDLKTAAAVLKNGGLVVFPTETVYGIGANALDARAVKAIFRAKGRPQDNPLIVHVDGMKMLSGIAFDVPETARKLFRAFSPGPLTVVLKKKPLVPDCVTAGLDTVAVRIPSHPAARSLIRACGFPLAAPSANRSGKPSPTTYPMALHEMDGRADAVIDGGNCGHGLESTVVSIVDDEVTILRPGSVTREMIEKVLKRKNVLMAPHRGVKGKTRSPGTKYAHYRPKAEVVLVDPERAERIASYLKKRKGMNAAVLYAGNMKNLPDGLKKVRFRSAAEYAKKLYSTFHELDRFGTGVIIAVKVPPEGIGAALMNRLLKASGGKSL